MVPRSEYASNITKKEKNTYPGQIQFDFGYRCALEPQGIVSVLCICTIPFAK